MAPNERASQRFELILSFRWRLEMSWFLLYVVACCSSWWRILRWTTWSSSRRNILRRWVSRVCSSAPLSSFPFFLLNCCITIHSCQCFCLRLRLSLLLLLLAILTSWALRFFWRCDILIALLPLLYRRLSLVVDNIHWWFWLLLYFVSVLLLLSWLFRLLLMRLILRITDFFCISICIVCALVRFQSFSISQRIQSMVCRGGTRVNTGDHDNLSIVSQERVSEDHRQLGSSEWNMPALCVQRPNTFFQCQKTLIDFCTLHTSLSIVTLSVCCTLWSRQIDKKQLSYRLPCTIFHLYLANSVRSRWRIVCSSAVSCSLTMSEINDIVHFFGTSCWSFGETRYLNFWLAIFLYL